MWSGNGNIVNENTANPTVLPATDTKYVLTVTDEYECIGTDSMLVKINPVGELSAGINQEICFGGSIILGGNPTAEGSILPYSYEWNHTGTLDNRTLANPIATPAETTTYSLIVYTGNCPADTLETTVTVNPLPVINIKNDTIVGFREDIILWATGGESYEWYPQEFLNHPMSQNPVANIEQTTHFTVEVTDINACKDTSGLTLYPKNEIFIPEMFSPNNDGMNDFFKIYGFGFKELYLAIYNQYGDIVFESNLLDEIQNRGWNGEYRGHQVEDGKYFWKINGEFYNGEIVLFNGTNSGVVTIIR